MTPATTGPFRGSTSDLTRQQLRGRRYRRLHRDVYVLQPHPTDDLAYDAVLLALPDARLSHQSAGRLWRLPVADDGRVHVTRPGTSVSRLPHVRTHRAALHPGDVDECRGRPVTSLPRTFVDLAATLSLDELVAVGDVVLRRAGAAALEDAVARAGRRKGVCRARLALPLLDPTSASPSETACRLLLHGAGWTALQHAVVVRDQAGRWLCEADLGDPAAKVAVQYDGIVHFGNDAQQRIDDVGRDELARAAGWQVVVLTAKDLRHPHLALAKVAAAYQRAEQLARVRTG